MCECNLVERRHIWWVGWRGGDGRAGGREETGGLAGGRWRAGGGWNRLWEQENIYKLPTTPKRRSGQGLRLTV